ncbi:uncharacterized protein [Physcomitrium patens]|uniref:Uncharacterized protein n=1 Tax=Physcomitrium patens TaxID=3218 RepID=A0A2K1JS82_PHYPA|nr:uncharacterized protein LOC112289307 isoform X1 [Physcomitrium patens]PNR44392.1 hypothetical protein PHYPA_016776 [Physcomitrium patens]|eukprot:XP_024390199.1 uncharacterized protein LOC112289307 isoform X1 [Physcomitrella patens]
MIGAEMTSRALCSCSAQVPGAQARLGTSRAGIGTSSFGLLRLNHLKPVKNFRRLQVQAAVEIDDNQVSNGPLRGSKLPPKKPVMVDPLEAKRLAALEWKQLQERVAFQKQQKIEAINGGWAVLGLMIGIVLEGNTGKGILAQVAGYLDSLADFIASITPGTPSV